MRKWLVMALCVVASLTTRGVSQCGGVAVDPIGGVPPGVNGVVWASAKMASGDVVVGGG
jgi:hypothetical protein